GVGSVLHVGGVVDDFDIRIDAVAFDAPGAVVFIEAEGGDGGVAAIDEAGVAGDADESAPGAGADEFAEAGLLEVIGESIAARAGGAVDEHALGAVVGIGRPLPVFAVGAGP